MFRKKTNNKVKTNNEKQKFNVPKVNNAEKENRPKREKKASKKLILENIRKNKKIYILTIVGICLIAIAILATVLLNNYFINKKYKKYEEKMNIYGFSRLYNNESPKSNEKVTNIEAVKIVLGTVYNTYDISSIGYQSEGKYEDDEWVKTAESFGILEKNKITKDNKDDNITYWEFIKMYINARNKNLNIVTSYTKESSFKNLYSFTQEQQKHINDLVENSLIQDEKKKIALDSDMIKGQANEIVINYVDKYNSIVDEDETLVTKTKSMPKNKDYYPYIVYSIPNEIYEIKHINQDNTGYISPKDIYKDKKEYYDQMEYRLNNYYDAILNVNYNDISTESFKNSIDEYLLYNYDNELFEEYVKYVKDNKIIIEGSAKALVPIIYYDGIDFRIRIKLTFKIVNSNTNENILFGDLRENSETPVKYSGKEYTLYIEAPMSRLLNVISYRTEIKSIINILSDKSNIKDNTL